jgi:hypothetical protein
MSVVGIMERMAESLCVMGAVLGSANPVLPDSTPKVNYNQFKDLPEVETLAQQVPHHYVQYDEQLYRAAQGLLDEQLRRYPQCRDHTRPER